MPDKKSEGISFENKSSNVAKLSGSRPESEVKPTTIPTTINTIPMDKKENSSSISKEKTGKTLDSINLAKDRELKQLRDVLKKAKQEGKNIRFQTTVIVTIVLVLLILQAGTVYMAHNMIGPQNTFVPKEEDMVQGLSTLKPSSPATSLT